MMHVDAYCAVLLMTMTVLIVIPLVLIMILMVLMGMRILRLTAIRLVLTTMIVIYGL